MSDIGHEQTDKELKKLEKKITQEYQKATKEVEKKMNDYLSKFAKKDKEMAKKVKNGEITSQEYAEWRQNQMLTGKRWEQMRDTLAQDLVNADKIAAGMINDTLPDAYALNFNYGTYEVESGAEINTSFTLYDHDTVERLMREDPKIIPKARIDIPKDQLWNRQKITSAVTQGILQGESIDKIAKRLGKVTDMDRNAAIRNARTYTTAAENGGRIDSYERANEQGIQVNKMWMATLDDRTRYEHRHLDGVSIPNDEAFEIDGYKIDYPGDPDAEPEMIYNCRCTLVADIKGVEYNDERNDSKLGEMTYDEWKHALDKRVAPGGTEEDEATNTTIEEEKTNVEPNTKGRDKYGARTEDGDEISDEEKRQIIQEELGVSEEKAEKFREALDDWNYEGGEVKMAQEMEERGRKYGVFTEYAHLTEEYIHEAPAYTGTMYRGIELDSKEEAERILQMARENNPEAFNYDHTITSWTPKKEIVEEYYTNENPIIFVADEGHTESTSISHFLGGEYYSEILASKDAQWEYVSDERDGDTIIIHVKEKDQEEEKTKPASKEYVGDTGQTFAELYGERQKTTSQYEEVMMDREAAAAWMYENLDIYEEESEKYLDALQEYSTGAYTKIHNDEPEAKETVETIDALLHDKFMPIYDGTIYRGVHVDDSEGLTAEEKVKAIISSGTWNEPGITSFTSDKKIAEDFANGGIFQKEDEGANVLIICKENKSGCPVAHLIVETPEEEVLVPSDIKERGYRITDTRKEGKLIIIEVEENEKKQK